MNGVIVIVLCEFLLQKAMRVHVNHPDIQTLQFLQLDEVASRALSIGPLPNFYVSSCCNPNTFALKVVFLVVLTKA